MSGLLLLRRGLHLRPHSYRLSQVRQYALIGKRSAKAEPIWTLPNSPARTRFAPSPTGYLHLGSLRTALYNYLLAQATGGQFIIRLEDTDQTRFINDAEQRLYEDLKWAGLHWDEGPDKGGKFGPYKQSDRLSLYQQHANMLLETGHAFRCFCSKHDLEFNLRQATAKGDTAHYPGTCMSISASQSDRRAANGEPHVLRFKTSETPISASDLVYGNYKKGEREDSFIIMKSDGFPTYHFANVVDDHLMKITHVIRGAEWLISTPKHVELYNAFGWEPPKFAHVGLLVDQQRQKLSKRDIENIGISVYSSNNILPAALLNFSVLLGWDPNLQNNPHLDKRGLMTLKEMKENFTLKFTRGDIIVDLAKLKFFQSRFIRNLMSGDINDEVALSTHIVQPILSEVKRLQVDLKRYAVKKESVDSETRSLMEQIHIGVENSLPEPTEEYVRDILMFWKHAVDDPRHFVHDNLYAFWPISLPALRLSFRELQLNKYRIKLEMGKKYVDISKILTTFRAKLTKIPADEWTAERVGDVVKAIVDRVKYYDAEENQVMDRSAGWKLLRWALLHGRTGFSVIPMMVYMGRHETMKRLRVARNIAEKEENKLAEKLEKKRFKSSPMYNSISLKKVKQKGADWATATMPIIANNLTELEKIQWNHPQGKEPNFLRPLHTKGPFASRPPPPRPLDVPRRTPKDVKRAPQFMDFEVWKSATRHLDVGNGKGMGQADAAPALGGKPQGIEQEAITPDHSPSIDTEGANSWASLERQADRIAQRRSTLSNSAHPVGTSITNSFGSSTGSMNSRANDRALSQKRGAFLPDTPIPDLKAHLEHVKILNRKAKQRRLARERSSETIPTSWKATINRGVGPMFAGKPVDGLPKKEDTTRTETVDLNQSKSDDMEPKDVGHR